MCMMSVLLPTFSPERKNKPTVTADILEQKIVPKPARKKNTAGKKIRYKINRRPSQSKNNSARFQAQIKRRGHEKSSVRAKVELVFAVLKLQLRYRKTRYRGLQKQTAKVNILLALANLILADRPGLTA